MDLCLASRLARRNRSETRSWRAYQTSVLNTYQKQGDHRKGDRFVTTFAL